jgi:hypothetical protein
MDLGENLTVLSQVPLSLPHIAAASLVFTEKLFANFGNFGSRRKKGRSGTERFCKKAGEVLFSSSGGLAF